ncbi:MAG: twin-arginine translocase subunit TatC [Muribaculaceae bacterium]|nr:twin-arginine translocase subunit TatC [Muribaculaceae bacterium]
MLTFEEHLEVLRRMLFRIVALVIILASVVFCFKEPTFSILLAPSKCDFVTFRLIEDFMSQSGMNFHFEEFHIPLISTDLSAQFMTHITISCILGVLLASPYIIFELFRFISPALYDSERRYSVLVAVIIYALFVSGLLMSYYVIFPISFRFLANYQVDESIKNTITLDSYISSFTTLMFMMGIVFQLPVFAFVLGRMGFIDADLLRRYRAYAFILIMIIAAIITPPDIFTLIIVTIPIYALYELSILVLQRWGPKFIE